MTFFLWAIIHELPKIIIQDGRYLLDSGVLRFVIKSEKREIVSKDLVRISKIVVREK